MTTGRAYRFKVRSVNFNGESVDSTETTLYSCLPPLNLDAPTYVSSTETTLTIIWNLPQLTNGCPIFQYKLWRDIGDNGLITTQVGVYEPHISSDTITFAGTDTTKTFRFQVEAFNNAGSVKSGVAIFVLSNVPETPLTAPVNDASVTNDQKIKVTYGMPLPDGRGSPITSIELQMDNGIGGDYVSLIGGTHETLITSMVITEGIVKGREYRFRYRCKNVNGWSAFSAVTYIKAAIVPAIPKAPTLISATATTMTL